MSCTVPTNRQLFLNVVLFISKWRLSIRKFSSLKAINPPYVFQKLKFRRMLHIKLIIITFFLLTSFAQNPGPDGVIIDIIANSENFCTTAYFNIELTGSLSSFQDKSCLIPKTSFLSGQTSYFKAMVNSPKATLKSTTIQRVEFTLYNSSTVLYDNYAFTSDGISKGFQIVSNGINDSIFGFNLTGLGELTGDSNENFRVYSTLTVQYLSIDGTTADVIVNDNEERGEVTVAQNHKFDAKLSLKSCGIPILPSILLLIFYLLFNM